MNRKWTYFLPAAFFGGWALVSNGVPLGPVLIGIGAAAVVTFWKQRSPRRAAKQ
jgi:hypothetical protein